MSAIFGLFDTGGGALNPLDMQIMHAALAHRGPDGSQVELGREFALGHCLLDTIGSGPAMGHLLITESHVTTADCRLDNRAELLASLHMPEAASDTTLLERGFATWGEDLPNHLLGDFAFAIWDRAAKKLFCARDHFGVKPFYYATLNGRFLFASEIRAVLEAENLPQRHNPANIASFLAGIEPEIDATSYDGVKRLPPGHHATLSGSTFAVTCYYRLPKPVTREAPDAPAEFRRLFLLAVQARLRGGPVGTMLSGGLDSSSIACAAAPIVTSRDGKDMPAFSMVFDETPELNERGFITAVLRHRPLAPHFIPSNNIAPFSGFDDILDEQQDLFIGINIAAGRRIYAQAQAAGVRVLLDGQGGDEVATLGGERLHQLAKTGQWRTLWHEVQAFVTDAEENRFAVFWYLLTRYSVLRYPKRVLRSLQRRLGLYRKAEEDNALLAITPEVAARTEMLERAMRDAEPPPGIRSDAEEQYQNLSHPMQAAAFESLDRQAAFAGVEARYPFWDKRLVEFSLTLPPHERMHGGWGRLILRRAMQGILPPEIQWRRSKLNFNFHIADPLARLNGELVEAALTQNPNPLAPYVDLAFMRDLFAHFKRRLPAINGYDLQLIWRVVALSFWLKRGDTSD